MVPEALEKATSELAGNHGKQLFSEDPTAAVATPSASIAGFRAKKLTFADQARLKAEKERT